MQGDLGETSSAVTPLAAEIILLSFLSVILDDDTVAAIQAEKEAVSVPQLTLHDTQRIATCQNNPAAFSLSLWTLVILLVNSPDGYVTFVDTCDTTMLGETPCPWRNGHDTKTGTRRSAACRISKRFFDAKIPFRVAYFECDETFRLIYCPKKTKKISVGNVETKKFFPVRLAPSIRKAVKLLKKWHDELQNPAVTSLVGLCGVIPPILPSRPEQNFGTIT